jgi:hypothetical protein
MRLFLAIAASLVASFVSIPALANESGLPGYSGKPNLAAPAGESCNGCHSGGTAPQVTLNGPATLTAGQVADYSLVVKTGSTRAAAGIAATDGIVLTPVTGLRDSFGEMVPNGAVTVSGGQATFNFKVTAPLSGTTLRLWGVGLSANNNGNTSGDKATHLVRDIAVTGGTVPKPDAGTSSGDGGPPSDGGTQPGEDGGSSGSSGGTSGSSGGTSGSSGGTSGSSGSGNGTPDPADPGAADGDGPGGASCAASSASRVPETHEALAVLLAAVGMMHLIRRRRRRA